MVALEINIFMNEMNIPFFFIAVYCVDSLQLIN